MQLFLKKGLMSVNPWKKHFFKSENFIKSGKNDIIHMAFFPGFKKKYFITNGNSLKAGTFKQGFTVLRRYLMRVQTSTETVCLLDN